MIGFDGAPEFIDATQDSLAMCVAAHREHKRPAVCVAAAARVPVEIGARPETRICPRQTLQGRIDGLFF